MKTARDRFADQSPAAVLSLAADARDAAKNAAARMSAGELEDLHKIGVTLLAAAVAEQINRLLRLESIPSDAGAMQ